jgi:hypothetical protein
VGVEILLPDESGLRMTRLSGRRGEAGIEVDIEADIEARKDSSLRSE